MLIRTQMRVCTCMHSTHTPKVQQMLISTQMRVCRCWYVHVCRVHIHRMLITIQMHISTCMHSTHTPKVQQNANQNSDACTYMYA